MGLEQFQVGYSSLWMFMAPCGFPQRPVFCETPPSPPSCPLGYRTGGQTGGKARDLSRCAVRRGDRAMLRVQGGQRLSLAAAEGRPSPGSVRLSVNPLPPPALPPLAQRGLPRWGPRPLGPAGSSRSLPGCCCGGGVLSVPEP